MYHPTSLSQSRIQVTEEGVYEDVAVSDMTDARLVALAQEYNRHGSAPLDVVVTYDPKSYRNTAMAAGDNAVRVSKILRGAGVSDIKSSIIPVNAQGDEARIMISYHAVSAKAPDGCADMPGMDSGKSFEADPDYKLGCGVNSLIAKQVANPSDLLGKDDMGDTSDGRAASNIVEGYRKGAQNKPLKGESSSGTK
jgi:pilus assembly protein CpaD